VSARLIFRHWWKRLRHFGAGEGDAQGCSREHEILQNSVRLGDELVPPHPDRGNRLAKHLFFAGKLIVSAACFWYVLRHISVNETLRALSTFDIGWAILAVLVGVTQIPLLALRLRAIMLGLAARPARLSYLGATAVTAIYAMIAQILPSLAGEGIRAWMLIRFGYGWGIAVKGVMIDRAIGAAVLFAFACAILPLPSALTALSGYRTPVIVVFGGALILGVYSLLLTPRMAPWLQRWRYSYWVGSFAADAHRVLLGAQGTRIFGTSCLIHVLTIIIIWLVSRAQGLSLSAPDCAVLFTVMVGVLLVPISVGGWGLREFAVVSLLGANGVGPERAVLFSVCFGLVFMVSALPGAVVYVLYPLPTKGAVFDVMNRAV